LDVANDFLDLASKGRGSSSDGDCGNAKTKHQFFHDIFSLKEI
jgi:hypothetical protein